jgi:hypothetical protein
MEPIVPGELELMMEPVQKKHFSTADWDFSGSEWVLDTSDYVDPPAALRWNYSNRIALLKQSSVGMPLPEGMIETYFKHKASTPGLGGWITIRNQSADGGAGSTNRYMLLLYGSVQGEGLPLDLARLVRASTDLETKTLNPPIYPYTWERVRVKWWVYAGVFFVRLEKYVNGEWVQLCGDWSDPTNYWATSSINRVGVRSLSTYPCLFDVTKIYRRVS